jgi:8-oxo-dGTP pyrophosphatase MutT (NUDIX family)
VPDETIAPNDPSETGEFRPALARLAAGVLFRDADSRVLLVKPTYKRGWDLPGGYVEPGEAPKRAAVREVAEELGLRVTVGRLLVVDWAPHPAEGDKLLFVFDGGTLDPALLTDAELQASEIGEVRFVADGELSALLPDRLVRRVRSALSVPADAYLEYGETATD